MVMKDTPIRRKLMTIILLTSTAVLMVMCMSFFVYEYVVFRYDMVLKLSTLGTIIANNSTAALAFGNPSDADEVLRALAADTHITAACLYDRDGAVFASYPDGSNAEAFPPAPAALEFRFGQGSLSGCQAVVLGGNRVGTLYIRSDLEALYQRFRLYALLVTVVMVASLAVAYVLSRGVQRQISDPLLALAETAKAIAIRGDYTVRASKTVGGELGLLTEAFNQMLVQIYEQDRALRDSEMRKSAIFESALDGIITADADGRIVEFNPAAEATLGFSRDQVLGQPLAGTIIPTRDRGQEQQGLTTYLTAGDEPLLGRRVEMTALHANETEIPVELAISVVQVQGRPLFTAYVRDIRERKAAEEQIRSLNADLERRVRERTAELEHVNGELEAFSYSVSHDLRAPLRSIDGFSQALLEDYAGQVDDTGQDYLRRVRSSTQRMGRLIDDMLQLARVARSTFDIQPVNLSQMVRSISEELRAKTPSRTVQVDVEENLDAECDPRLVRIALENLVGNAWKYTARREIAHIRFGSCNESAVPLYFLSDDGVGFDIKYVDKLFAPFQRLHGQDEFEGTGIGLATVKRVIARHGGTVWAEGAVNQGATIYFTLTPGSQGGDHDSRTDHSFSRGQSRRRPVDAARA